PEAARRLGGDARRQVELERLPRQVPDVRRAADSDDQQRDDRNNGIALSGLESSPMPSRRTVLLAPVAAMAATAVSAAGKMTLAIHQNTSNAAGYRGSLEGWARAGIKYVELTNTMLDGFLKT